MTLPNLFSIDVDGVVVEARVFDEAEPLVPADGHVSALVLVEVFSKVAWKVQEIIITSADSYCLALQQHVLASFSSLAEGNGNAEDR